LHHARGADAVLARFADRRSERSGVARPIDLRPPTVKYVRPVRSADAFGVMIGVTKYTLLGSFTPPSMPLNAYSHLFCVDGGVRNVRKIRVHRSRRNR